jgi:kynureninase
MQTDSVPTRAEAERLDAADPLAGFRDRFVVTDPDLIYLDGNSLGRLPLATAERLRTVVEREWGGDLVRAWPRWIERPALTGDLIGTGLLGAAPGQVVVSDSTTVNLYKLAAAALDARPGRTVIVTDDDNFPTDRYVLAGLAGARGLELRLLASDPVGGPDPAAVAAALGPEVALVSLSAVAYRSGALAGMGAINRAAHDAGALTLWDLSHAAGAVPLALDADGTDLAVGCTYKYLHGGPGAPAFLYVRRELQPSLRSPIQGWFGQRDQFAMGPRYEPAEGVTRFLTGTPDVIGLAAVEEGARIVAEAGPERLAAKSAALTAMMIALADAWLAPLGFTVATPRDPARRAGHVALASPDAWPVCQALADRGVVGDFRGPDRLRLGPVPLTTSFTQVWDAFALLRDLVAAGEHTAYPREPGRVT